MKKFKFPWVISRHRTLDESSAHLPATQKANDDSKHSKHQSNRTEYGEDLAKPVHWADLQQHAKRKQGRAGSQARSDAHAGTLTEVNRVRHQPK